VTKDKAIARLLQNLRPWYTTVLTRTFKKDIGHRFRFYGSADFEVSPKCARKNSQRRQSRPRC
jgi:hypothetical protein